MDPLDQFVYAHPLSYCLILVGIAFVVIIMGYLYEKSRVVHHIFEKIGDIHEKILVNFKWITIVFVTIMLGGLLFILIFLYLYSNGILK